MKNIFKVFIMTAALIVSFNVNSFALVDGAVWGGYVFNGEVENSNDESMLPESYWYLHLYRF